MTVVVPAHDERDWLPGCLRALGAARAAVRVPVRLVVVLDACTDDTASIVGPDVHTVVVQHRNVGAARAAGFAAVAASPSSWFATTDADSRVPWNWLVAQLASATTHDLFVGTVAVQAWSARPAHAESAHHAAYEPRPGHPHVHGANLGVSAAAYARLGGFAPLGVGEDQDLVDRAAGLGLRIDRSAAAPVVTSARVSHRAPGGFSSALDGLVPETRS